MVWESLFRIKWVNFKYRFLDLVISTSVAFFFYLFIYFFFLFSEKLSKITLWDSPFWRKWLWDTYFWNPNKNSGYHIYLLTLTMPGKTTSENVVCLCRLLNILANFSNIFLHSGKQSGPWVWSGSTLFAKITFKISSRWQSRRQLLWLAV